LEAIDYEDDRNQCRVRFADPISGVETRTYGAGVAGRFGGAAAPSLAPESVFGRWTNATNCKNRNVGR
jgi:hypothetical protein